MAEFKSGWQNSLLDILYHSRHSANVKGGGDGGGGGGLLFPHTQQKNSVSLPTVAFSSVRIQPLRADARSLQMRLDGDVFSLTSLRQFIGTHST